MLNYINRPSVIFTLSIKNLNIYHLDNMRRKKYIIFDSSIDLNRSMNSFLGLTGSGKSVFMSFLSGTLEDNLIVSFKDFRMVFYDCKTKQTKIMQYVSYNHYVEKFIKLNYRNYFLSFIPQELSLFINDSASVINNYRLFLEMRAEAKLDIRYVQRRFLRICSMFQLNARVMNQTPNFLSGGEKKRFVLACALALRPKIIFVDELESGLDVVNQLLIFNCLKSYILKNNCFLIFITHNTSIANLFSFSSFVFYKSNIMKIKI